MSGRPARTSSGLIDVSTPLSARTAVFPGDSPLSREVLMDHARGDHLTLSTLRTTVHVGTHLDAPSHYGGTRTIESIPLERTCGECLVVACGGEVRDRRASRANLARSLESLGFGGAATLPARVLIATGSFPDPHQWTEGFTALEPELVDHLADRGATLLGVDVPSVDCADSKDLPSHARCLARGVLILEGLRLGHVAPGRYELLCLPLLLEGFDASPVRAALRPL